jgi:hypothetical protein
LLVLDSTHVISGLLLKTGNMAEPLKISLIDDFKMCLDAVDITARQSFRPKNVSTGQSTRRTLECSVVCQPELAEIADAQRRCVTGSDVPVFAEPCFEWRQKPSDELGKSRVRSLVISCLLGAPYAPKEPCKRLSRTNNTSMDECRATTIKFIMHFV